VSHPIVVGEPSRGGIAAARAFGRAGGTLAWHDADALRDATDALGSLGWDALLVDPANEPLSTAAMGHRAQIHGTAAAVVLAADDPADAENVSLVALMVMRHLPAVPAFIAGEAADSVAAFWKPHAEALEVEPAAAPDDLAAAYDEALLRLQEATAEADSAHGHGHMH
jgi:hypothetical protein